MDLPNEEATGALAARLARLVRPGDVIGLTGPLGSGKTSFARAFLRASGVAGEVPSPTFTLVQTYDIAAGSAYHFDLYRLEKPEEALELGIDDAFAEGVSLIEWPERLIGLLPADRLEVALAQGVADDAREATLTGFGAWGPRLREAGLA